MRERGRKRRIQMVAIIVQTMTLSTVHSARTPTLMPSRKYFHFYCGFRPYSHRRWPKHGRLASHVLHIRIADTDSFPCHPPPPPPPSPHSTSYLTHCLSSKSLYVHSSGDAGHCVLANASQVKRPEIIEIKRKGCDYVSIYYQLGIILI